MSGTGDDDGPLPTKTLVKRLFDEHPPGEFQEVIHVGFTGMDSGDPVLAKACADYVLSRAETGSGDMMRAMLLRAYVSERAGKEHRATELMEAIITGKF